MEQVQVEGLHPVLGRESSRPLAGGAADIRHHEIESAECRGALVDEALDLTWSRDVGDDAVGLNACRAQLGQSRLERVGAPPADAHLDSFHRQPQRNRTPNPAAGAGDQPDLSCEPEIQSPLMLSIRRQRHQKHGGLPVLR